MAFLEQLSARRKALKRPVREVAAYVAMDSANVYRLLAGNRDVRASTLDALAAALDAKWVLVPKHLLPEIERVLLGMSPVPDEIPSSVQRMLKGKK